MGGGAAGVGVVVAVAGVAGGAGDGFGGGGVGQGAVAVAVGVVVAAGVDGSVAGVVEAVAGLGVGGGEGDGAADGGAGAPGRAVGVAVAEDRALLAALADALFAGGAGVVVRGLGVGAGLVGLAVAVVVYAVAGLGRCGGEGDGVADDLEHSLDVGVGLADLGALGLAGADALGAGPACVLQGGVVDFAVAVVVEAVAELAALAGGGGLGVADDLVPVGVRGGGGSGAWGGVADLYSGPLAFADAGGACVAQAQSLVGLAVAVVVQLVARLGDGQDRADAVGPAPVGVALLVAQPALADPLVVRRAGEAGLL